MTRNAERAARRRAIHRLTYRTVPISPPSEIIRTGYTPRGRKPRGAWSQGAWSRTSPYYFNLITIDQRWSR